MSNHSDMPAKGNDNRLKSEMRVYYGPTQQTVLSGFSLDLSTGGLYLKTDYDFKVDENLMLIFSLPEQEKTISELGNQKQYVETNLIDLKEK